VERRGAADKKVDDNDELLKQLFFGDRINSVDGEMILFSFQALSS